MGDPEKMVKITHKVVRGHKIEAIGTKKYCRMVRDLLLEESDIEVKIEKVTDEDRAQFE